MSTINDRCPLQSECGRKSCKHQHHERDCSYYQGNARPGAEIQDQVEAMEAEWEARMSNTSVLADAPAPAAPQEAEPVMENSSPLVFLSVNQLHPHPDNPRKELGDLTELADSIKASGILQNLTVVPDNTGYTVIIGHRRLAAAKLAGLTEVPCVITEMDQKEQIQTMLLENMVRSDLTPYEEAQGFQMMLDLGSTVEEIAEKSGFSKTTVRHRVKLLDLDADKFKKSEARGATLQDYLELEKIDDPQLKNKALDAIGTANFRDTLKKAIDEEKLKKRLAQWEADVSVFATKIEKRGYVGDTEVPMDYCRNYNRWNQSAEVEKPTDADTARYYYTISDIEVYLYKDHQEHVETEEDRQRQERLQASERIKAELQEITRRHFALRSEFISSFGAAKKNALQIMKFVTGIIIGDGSYSRDDVNVDLLAKLLNLDIDENTTYPELKAMVDACSEKRQEYIMLACAYASCDEDDNGYWNWQWSDGAYHYVHTSNDDLDHLYDFLVSIGYEMSDEEKALRDGTHELFHREETEKKETAPAEAGADQEGESMT